jgi:hypothetical protein
MTELFQVHDHPRTVPLIGLSPGDASIPAASLDPTRHFGKTHSSRMVKRRAPIPVGKALRTGIDQQADDLLMDRAAIAKDHGFQQRGPAKIVDMIDVDRRVEQYPNRARMTVMRGRDQSRAAVAIGIAEPGLAGGKDQLEDGVPPFRAGVEKGRVPNLILRVDVGARFDQLPGQIDGIGVCRQEQRGTALPVAGFQIGPAIDGSPELGNIVVTNGFVQHRLSPCLLSRNA